MLDIAKEAGVKQVVASTTLGVSQLDANVRVYPGSFMEKHMLNKKAVENSVEERGFEHFSFLRPTFFMANFLEPKVKRYEEIRDHRSWTTSMTAETPRPSRHRRIRRRCISEPRKVSWAEDRVSKRPDGYSGDAEYARGSG
jgi:hypothetical protein